MKVPDKFYAEVNYETGFVCGYAEPTKSDDIEYIRKDALLEWANNMKRICKGAEPIEKAYQTMIDKLNEM